MTLKKHIKRGQNASQLQQKNKPEGSRTKRSIQIAKMHKKMANPKMSIKEKTPVYANHPSNMVGGLGRTKYKKAC